MGKPLSRPDCLRQNPRCLGKGDDEEAYIEDCYVPQRSIYDTMRINEQIDQGSKLSQPSRSTLGSGGGEGSTLSSNGTLGADIGGVFVARGGPADAGMKKLDERVIFDALKLTSDPQSMSPVGGVGSSVVIPSSNSAAVGAAVVTKRRHQGSDKKDNPNRRSWKAFMPPTYPEFAERLELSPGESGEKRLSGAGIPVSLLHPLPSLLASSIPSTPSTPLAPPFSPSPALPGGPQTPPVSSSPSFTPTVSPVPSHLSHLLKQKQSLQLHSHKPATALSSPSKEQPPSETTTFAHSDSPQPSPIISQAEKKRGEQRKQTQALMCVRSISEELPQNWDTTAAKTSDNERDSPLLENDQDTTPLIPPKPVFCPPTKARTWPRRMRGSKRSLGHGRILPILPPLPPILGEESDEESLYLLDPPSPFLQEGDGLNYGGLPLSPCISQEGGEEGLLGWPPPTGGLREKTASELCFEEDERRILEEEDEMNREQEKKEVEERLEMEERNWQAVLKLESSETSGISWEVEEDESQLQDWETQQLASSGHWPLLMPPVGFGGSEAHSASPCPSSEAGSDELFLELERQCLEEDTNKLTVSEQRDLSHTSEYLDTFDNLLVLKMDQVDAKHDCDIKELYDEDCAVVSAHDVTDHVEHTDPTEPCVTQMNNNFTESTQSCFSVEDIDQSPDQLQSCLSCNSEGNNHDQDDYNSYIVDADALDSESSGIQTSHQDGTVPSDAFQTVSYEQPESDSDLGSGASSDHEQKEDEEIMKQDETSGIHISLQHGLLRLDNLNADPECNVNLVIFTTDLEGVEIEDSIHQFPEFSVLKDEAEREVKNRHYETVSHEDAVSSEPAQVTMEMTSDQEGSSSISEKKEEIPVSLEVFVQEEVSSHEWEVTEAVQGTTSTPNSSSSYPQLDSPNISIESAPPSPLPVSTTKHESRTAVLDSKDAGAFVATDSFVYLAVAVPPQYPQDCPSSPSVESAPPSPLPKCCPEAEEGAFLSSDSFVYLAAPERLLSDGGSACEDCQDLDSESEETQSGVDFVLGSMTGDSEWDSDGSGLDPVHQQRDQWDQLEPGLLHGLFNEGENEASSQETVESRDHDCEDTCETSSVEEISPLKHDLDLDTKVKKKKNFL